MTITAVDKAIDSALAEQRIVGAVVLVARDGTIVYKLVGPVTAENLDGALNPEIAKAAAAAH